MDSYRKLVLTGFGSDLEKVLEIVEDPIPEPGPGEVVVRNTLAGVNPGRDLLMCRNTLKAFPVDLPADMGLEAAGEVARVGEGVDGLAEGDPVLTVRDGGGYREYQLLPAAEALKIDRASPERLALARSGVIASVALAECGRIAEGETVMITAAAGAVGHVAVQLARRAGAHVIGTCGTPKKAALLRDLGCDRVINYRDETIRDVLEDEYRDRLDLVLDGVGGKFFDAALEQLAPRGRIVCTGFFSEYAQEPEGVKRPRVYHRLLWKSASIRGCLVPLHFTEHLAAHRERLFDLQGSGKLKVVLDKGGFKGLEGVADAIEHCAQGKSCGKVVVAL